MNDKIKNEIDQNNLESAKNEIQKLEESLLTEKSEYVRCKTLEKINEYKAFYSDKMEFKDKKLDKIDRELEGTFETFKTEDALIREDFVNKTLSFKTTFKTGKIANCIFCTFEFFEVKESLVIENCKDCVIICKTKQLRIKNSKRMEFKVFIGAGTSLENCQEIEFSDLKNENLSTLSLKNNYKNVKDFTNPFSEENYCFDE